MLPLNVTLTLPLICFYVFFNLKFEEAFSKSLRILFSMALKDDYESRKSRKQICKGDTFKGNITKFD